MAHDGLGLFLFLTGVINVRASGGATGRRLQSARTIKM